MSKILFAGAGGAPTENVILSVLEAEIKEDIIGMGSEPSDLMLSAAPKKYQIPYAVASDYKTQLFKILKKEKPDLTHFQNDIEIRIASRMREEIIETGTKLFMPNKECIENCVDKSKSAKIWHNAGITVPKTIEIDSPQTLKNAFETLSNDEGKIWLRANEGGGGKGALPADNYEFAKLWIDRFNGWGGFTAAEMLETDTVTWLSIWYEGELVVAQTRKRKAWNFGNRTLSGVTGITHVGETASDPVVDQVALAAIEAIDKRPHGIYGVDMTYDKKRLPNPTEINISRFFTTVYFFTAAGLNMPEIFKDIALYNKFPNLPQKINPLPNGLLWIRGMDRKPILTTAEEMRKTICQPGE